MSSYYYDKSNVSINECRMYRYATGLKLPFVPKWYSYDKIKSTMRTRKINALSVADMYGADFEKVPATIISQIRDIIKKLYQAGIIYPDITGYNFIQDSNDRVWIVDFEHCFYLNQNQSIYNVMNSTDANENTFVSPHLSELELTAKQLNQIKFVHMFCTDDKTEWNPEFL